MPLAATPKGSVFFAHVPKTGGTSVEDYLAARFGALALLDGAWSDHGAGQRDIIQPPQHLTAADLAAVLPRDIVYSFAVVRDPLQRLISEYRFQAGISKSSGLGFSQWLRIILAAARQDPRVYHNHIRPQSDLVPEGADIFRLEDGFDGIISKLDQLTGESAPNISVKHLLKRSKKVPKLYRQDLQLIRDFYAKDYARFGYDSPSLSDHPNDPLAAIRAIPAVPFARLLVMKQRRNWLR